MEDPRPTSTRVLEICGEVADAVSSALDHVADWSLLGEIPGQYALDLVADTAALEVLARYGIGVLSEETGRHFPDSPLVAVVDPVDGSTNASRGIAWYATSICVVDENGPWVAVVANQASGVRYHAVRGSGAWRGGRRLSPSACTDLSEAIVGLSGYPSRYMGWSQYRALGAAALDLCAVAEGSLDAYAVVGTSALGAWDYLGGMLICSEAGVPVDEVDGLELVVLDHEARRSVVAASTPELLEEVRAAALAARPV